MRCWGFEEGVIVDTPVEQPRLCVFAGYLYKHTYTYHIFIHILFLCRAFFSAMHFVVVEKFFGLEVWFEVGLKLA